MFSENDSRDTDFAVASKRSTEEAATTADARSFAFWLEHFRTVNESVHVSLSRGNASPGFVIANQEGRTLCTGDLNTHRPDFWPRHLSLWSIVWNRLSSSADC
jgi:hypothetical protein